MKVLKIETYIYNFIRTLFLRFSVKAFKIILKTFSYESFQNSKIKIVISLEFYFLHFPIKYYRFFFFFRMFCNSQFFLKGILEESYENVFMNTNPKGLVFSL